MSTLMQRLYESRVIDKENVSIHSAFICMLHLANEQGLQFTHDYEDCKGLAIESDFTIDYK
jgi:hypothetical protein